MRRLSRLLLPLVLVLAAAGCGDDDEAADADPAASTTTAGDDEAAGGEDDADADEDAGDDGTSSVPTTSTIPTDSPAGDGPGGAGELDGMGDALLVADLAPDAEVPGPGAAGASGRFEAELVDGVLCVDMVVRDLGDAVLGAHVHEGAAGAAGPVVVDIGPPTAEDGAATAWTDACTEVPDDVIERLAAAPDQHYVNVHTPSFPDGAVRGQLAVTSVFDRTLG